MVLSNVPITVTQTKSNGYTLICLGVHGSHLRTESSKWLGLRRQGFSENDEKDEPEGHAEKGAWTTVNRTSAFSGM